MQLKDNSSRGVLRALTCHSSDKSRNFDLLRYCLRLPGMVKLRLTSIDIRALVADLKQRFLVRLALCVTAQSLISAGTAPCERVRHQREDLPLQVRQAGWQGLPPHRVRCGIRDRNSLLPRAPPSSSSSPSLPRLLRVILNHL